jgi:signal transduction histidine kinase
VDNIAGDPRSVGFPPGHPPMQTFLGVPIVLHGRTYGNLYLTDKQSPGGPIPFTDGDAQAVSLFAAQAAITMENARLHSEVQGLGAAMERDRIARELHDSLAQALGYVRMQAAIGRTALPNDPTAAGAALDRIDTVTADAYAEVREAILGLRTSGANADRSLVDALREYIDRYQEQAGVAVELRVGPGVSDAGLAPAVEVQLVRIIQEALANVRKHARTASAALDLELVTSAGGPRIRAVVTDKGRGFAVGQPAADAGSGHFGLAVMRERAEGIGGTLSVTSAPDRGTRVSVEVPVSSAPHAAVEA